MAKVLILAGVGIAVVIGTVLFVAPKKSTVSPAPAIAKVQSNGRYVDYSPAAYAAAAGKRRVLYFYATWCPTCSVANEDFTVNSSRIPEDAVIFRTDYDQETALKAKDGITYKHTFVQVDKSGNELAKWNGGGLNELINQLTD